MISINLFVLLTFFNPIITFIVGFVINNLLDRKPYKWIIAAAAAILFFLLIVGINNLDLAAWQTWLYGVLYIGTIVIGMIVAIATRKYRYKTDE